MCLINITTGVNSSMYFDNSSCHGKLKIMISELSDGDCTYFEKSQIHFAESEVPTYKFKI